MAYGVFWAAAEPLSHFIETPPYFSGTEAKTVEAEYMHLRLVFWIGVFSMGNIRDIRNNCINVCPLP